MESFWGSLNNELVHHCRFARWERAKQEITELIEIFYNRIRKHARPGYLSPAAFNQRHYAKNGRLIRWTLRLTILLTFIHDGYASSHRDYMPIPLLPECEDRRNFRSLLLPSKVPGTG